jgi:hypothetical protein
VQAGTPSSCAIELLSVHTIFWPATQISWAVNASSRQVITGDYLAATVSREATDDVPNENRSSVALFDEIVSVIDSGGHRSESSVL